ncbi:hypothetical protein [Pedobacter duraquae]|uniref:Uncharacterized protein n=1 Tax=Pedobacter duraquae TaxID=425511 RepID=A0A4R6ICV1_9SPHI|nr:hypothetical protein [Pedobacter duraquae]TDO19348.1 hypothetical protein CLV32_4588 [Pedobacter duraquae]
MNIETIQFILSIWGAGLSSLLGGLTVFKFYKESKVKLLVFSTVDYPFAQVHVSAINDNNKPLTVTQVYIAYGSSKTEFIKILVKDLEGEKRLSESDRYTVNFDRIEIMEAYRNSDIRHNSYHRLLVCVRLSNGKIFKDWVYIDPTIIESTYYDKAEQFIATDIFLGIGQSSSDFFEIGSK